LEKQIGPGFKSSTGYTFVGYSGDSGALATEIKGKVRQGDVHVSASPSTNAERPRPDNEPGLKAITTDASTVRPENALVGRLQSGQLDVGFFYAADQGRQHRNRSITGGELRRHVQVTVLNGAPQTGAASFVNYLLGP
jgi:hypothetical protein